MRLRPFWLAGWLLCLGCQTLTLPDFDNDAEQAAVLWQQGQDAMQAGDADRAIGYYEQSLLTDPAATRSHLSLAAAYLEKGDDVQACAQMESYLKTHPEHYQVRVHYAELLVRLERMPEAKTEFTRFLGEAQEHDGTTREQIHCHARLMDLAEAEGDDYGIYLHRGVGLFLLARERAKVAGGDGELPVESLLCRACKDLMVARGCRPEQAQPCWYLYGAWSALGQRQPALRWLHRCCAAAPFAPMTAAEQRGLELACRQRQTPAMRY